MNELPLEGFQYAIHETHGAWSRLADRVHVEERFEGDPVWEGEVLVFDLLDHPTSERCYAWEVDGQVTVVLHTGPVDSPVKAVRASILADGEAPGVNRLDDDSIRQALHDLPSRKESGDT